MALKILGQFAGTGAQLLVYTVPASTQTVTPALVLQNTSKTAAAPAVTVAVAKGGAADAVAHQVLDVDLAVRGRAAALEGWTLAAGDVVRVTAPATVAINLFGSESAA